MKDHFGDTIEVGDLVVCMAIGRYSGMSTGIATNDKGGVRYEHGGTGGTANQVRIDTDNNPAMLRKKQEILAKFLVIDQEASERKKKDQKKRLKKSEMVRFGVYSSDQWSIEVYCGKAMVDNEPYDNLWIKMYKKDWDKDFTLDNCKITATVTTSSWRRNAGEINWDLVRDVKFPTKTKEHFILKQSTLEDLLGTKRIKLV